MKRLDVFRTVKTGVSKESPADEALQDFLFGNMGTVPVFCILLETQEPSLCFFREKTLMNKIDNVRSEVNECIKSMRPLVQYLNQLNLTSAKMARELKAPDSIGQKPASAGS
ncbi:hypothetical protein ACOSZF_12510 [Cytobacillus firmus]|uniref:hypothetical protein n=1 Tax=Cytobacillus firmus TaxID=1399 RepID=UPI003BA1E7CE